MEGRNSRKEAFASEKAASEDANGLRDTTDELDCDGSFVDVSAVETSGSLSGAIIT